MSLAICNQSYAIDFHPTDFGGFKTTPCFKPSKAWGISYRIFDMG